MPYSLCPDKETRNSFRRFQAENPDNFDYAAALIPIEKPLTPEEEARQAAKRNEKKKAQRAGMYYLFINFTVMPYIIGRDLKNRPLNTGLSDKHNYCCGYSNAPKTRHVCQSSNLKRGMPTH